MSIDQIIARLLANRNLTTPEEISEFFTPIRPEDLSTPFDSTPAIGLIHSHIDQKNQIFIYGDYDVDGVCSTAILWETLYHAYERVLPHIPDRKTEGYGLSIAGIDKCLARGAKLIIAVDNGIAAHEAVNYCRALGCDIIIIDHHEVGETLPTANVILHSTTTCAAGLSWFFCRDFTRAPHTEHLSLVSLAVICDLVPLLGINRSFATYGLQELNQTKRLGLRALLSEDRQLDTYAVGYIIGPRLNATGRLEHAIDSLRLLCTKDFDQAQELAKKLNTINASRQELTESSILLASQQLSTNPTTHNSLLITSSTTYHEGIIGLIASRLTEKHYRPSIAISIGDTHSKGSARSITGFHITDHLRQFSHLLVNVGGHAAAAGFTIENSKLDQFIQLVQIVQLPPEILTRKSRIDCDIPLRAINHELYAKLQEFQPFGLGNPTPTFQSTNVAITNPRRIGKQLNHLKFKVDGLEAVYFNAMNYEPRATGNIIYTIDLNEWNGSQNLQLIVKSIV